MRPWSVVGAGAVVIAALLAASASGGAGRPAGPVASVPAWCTVKAGPKGVEPTRLVFISNLNAVYNGAKPTTFATTRPWHVTQVETYHWNNGQGSPAPGRIGITDLSTGATCSWQAYGQPGQGGVPNAYWFADTSIDLPPGRYQTYDSDPGTWSQNSGTGGKGMGWILVTPVAGKPATPTTPKTTTTAATTTTKVTVVPPGPPNPILHPALQKTIKAPSALMEFALTVKSPKELTKGVKSATISGKGGIDSVHNRMQLTISLGQLGTVLKTTQPIELIVLGKALYVKLPASMMKKAPGKTWARFDMADAKSAAGKNQGALGNLDLRRTVAVLEGAAGVRKVGTGSVHGVPCTHYVATLDLARMTKSVQASRQKFMPQLIKALGRSTLPADVWIGSDGYVHRVSIASTVVNSTTKPPSKVGLVISLDAWGYGSKIDPKAPPAAQVADGSALLKGSSLSG